MTVYYGVRRSTDHRDGSAELKRFGSKAKALEWREREGADGNGQPFAPYTGHRYLRRVYAVEGRLPTGTRLIKMMDLLRCSIEAAKAGWVEDNGIRVE